jgi:hypothetical protein
MHDDKRLARGILIAAAAVFAVAACSVGQDLRYAVAGRTATATVDGVTGWNAAGRRTGSRRPIVLVDYHFTDAGGTARTGVLELSPFDPRPPKGSTIIVEYVDGSSRPPGRLSGGALSVFFGSLVALAAGALFYRHKVRQRAEGA